MKLSKYRRNIVSLVSLVLFLGLGWFDSSTSAHDETLLASVPTVTGQVGKQETAAPQQGQGISLENGNRQCPMCPGPKPRPRPIP